jgi:hypothetical protein
LALGRYVDLALDAILALGNKNKHRFGTWRPFSIILALRQVPGFQKGVPSAKMGKLALDDLFWGLKCQIWHLVGKF